MNMPVVIMLTALKKAERLVQPAEYKSCVVNRKGSKEILLEHESSVD